MCSCGKLLTWTFKVTVFGICWPGLQGGSMGCKSFRVSCIGGGVGGAGQPQLHCQTARSSCKAWVARAALHWQDSMHSRVGGNGQWQSTHFGFCRWQCGACSISLPQTMWGFENIEHCFLETFFWMRHAWEHDMAAGILLVILGYTATPNPPTKRLSY